ncbi:MAG: cupredoxin domain-containing protein, partial [Actinobacteria bacterium]|nr:cupredoxin domain-containing protein [Actinomycetota bacterium]
LTESPPRVGTLGVSHGTPTGNRLRPEDSVSTDVQFEAQQAVYERRKMIDELVSSGVPAVTASDERSGSGFLALLYLLIPLVAVFILAGQNSSSTSEEAPPGAEGGASGGAAPAPQGDVQVSAEGLAFDTDTIELAADKPQTIGFANEDTADHNISIYESADDAGSQSNALFEGEVISAGASTTYDVDPIPKGNYPFQCDIHPTMAGETVVG